MITHKTILGLDASTTTVGWCYLEDKKILDMGFLDISKFDSNKDKANYVLAFIKKHNFFNFLERIQIEDSLSGFAGGRTSQQIIVKLAKFNAILCYVLEENLTLPLISVPPMTARKGVFGKAFIKGMKSKEYVKQQIDARYNLAPWTIVNKKGNEDKRMEDARDALVVSLYKNLT